MVRGVLWDVGNVIVRWDPRTLYSKIFDDPAERDWFLAHVCTREWNEEFDRGRPFAEGIAEATARHPAYAPQISAWQTRFLEMISGVFSETEDAIHALAARGVPQFALTNMEITTWPKVRALSAACDHFQVVVVSGEEGLIKPDPAIFEVACAKIGLAAGELLFIDDSAANIATAQRLGFDTHHFADPVELAPALQRRGLL